MKKTTKIVVGVVVAVAAFFLLCIAMAGPTDPSVSYDYKIEESYGWKATEDDYLDEVVPDKGKKFAIAHIMVKNNHASGLSSNPNNWDIVYNGIVYDTDWIGHYHHPDYEETREVLVGYSLVFQVVYQIPEDASVSWCKIIPDYHGDATVEFDPDLF